MTGAIVLMAFGVLLTGSGVWLIVTRRSYAAKPPWGKRRLPARYLLAEALVAGTFFFCFGCFAFVQGILMVR